MVNTFKTWWLRLSNKPCGKWLFSRIVGRLIPYTGTISPLVRQVRRGYAEVIMHDRRLIRNHLSSIHAIALVNLGEYTTGLALHFAMAHDDRAILTKLSVEYLKKARGTIRAEASIDKLLEGDNIVKATLKDQDSHVVAVVHATWRVGKNVKANILKDLA
jgi:acyl-coenzyme A thioesterase PaaI-like protein